MLKYLRTFSESARKKIMVFLVSASMALVAFVWISTLGFSIFQQDSLNESEEKGSLSDFQDIKKSITNDLELQGSVYELTPKEHQGQDTGEEDSKDGLLDDTIGESGVTNEQNNTDNNKNLDGIGAENDQEGAILENIGLPVAEEISNVD